MSRKYRRRILVILVGSLVVAFIAATAAAQLPKSPTGEKDFPVALAPMVEAEYAFAQYSIAHGMKDAFLQFAAPDGIMIRDAPVNAIELWTKRNPAPTGQLSWYPIFADVSRAGDLGYTTGPWEFRVKATDKDAASNGHFITLWRRQPDGNWKFEFDLGISHPAPSMREASLNYPVSARAKFSKGNGAAGMDAARASLIEAERVLAKDASAKGSAKAFIAHADKDVRLYREDNLPYVGIESARKILEGKSEGVAWKALKAHVARSGDLGYAYGTYETQTLAAVAKRTDRGHYMRIWKRLGGKWRVVLDIASPLAPPKQ